MATYEAELPAKHSTPFSPAGFPILIRLSLRKEINCDQREQKVGNKHCRASIVFRDSLPKKSAVMAAAERIAP
jgi:hypothetical protein